MDRDIPDCYVTQLVLLQNGNEDVTRQSSLMRAVLQLQDGILHAGACVLQSCGFPCCSLLRTWYQKAVTCRTTGRSQDLPHNSHVFVTSVLDYHVPHCKEDCKIPCCHTSKVDHVSKQQLFCNCILCSHEHQCSQGVIICWLCKVVSEARQLKETSDKLMESYIGFGHLVVRSNTVNSLRLPAGTVHQVDDQGNYLGLRPNQSLLPISSAQEWDPSDWEKIEKLGKGAYGMVYKIKKRKTDNMFALKEVTLVRCETHDDRIRITTFTLREIEALRRLPHVNIVKIFGARPLQPNSDTLVIFMELMHTSLGRYVRENGRMNEAQTSVLGISQEKRKVFLRQLISALIYLHGKEMIHMDIKPDNVLIDVHGYRLKLTDFNQVYFKGHDDHSIRLGTAPFLAPEFVENIARDFPIDVYGVALCIVAMLTSQLPRNYMQLRKQLWDVVIDKLRRYNQPHPLPGFGFYLSGELELYKWMLNPDPKERPTATEVYDVLEDPSAFPFIKVAEGRLIDIFVKKTIGNKTEYCWIYSTSIGQEVDTLPQLQLHLDKRFPPWKSWMEDKQAEIISYDIETSNVNEDPRRSIAADIAFLAR